MTSKDISIAAKQYLHRVGRCKKCIRDSFLLMIGSFGSLGAAMIVSLIFGNGIFTYITAVVAFATTSLFVVHIFVAGVLGGISSVSSHESVAGTSNEPVPAPLSRRAVFARFARFAGVASASALMVAATTPSARAGYYCMYIGTECPDSTICCGDKRYSPATPYCCPSGTFCNGQGGCINAY